MSGKDLCEVVFQNRAKAINILYNAFYHRKSLVVEKLCLDFEANVQCNITKESFLII